MDFGKRSSQTNRQIDRQANQKMNRQTTLVSYDF